MLTSRVTLFCCAALFVAGCKSAPPPPTPAPASTTPKPTRFDGMTDEQLVHANQTDGLGLGLKVPGIDGNRFPAGAPIPLHLVLEDLAAREPVAGGLCGGFSLVALDLNTQDSQTNELATPHCFAAVPYPDEIPLEKGKLKVADLTAENFGHMALKPGTYQLTLTWHALPAGKQTFPERPAYTTVLANPVQVTVTQ